MNSTNTTLVSREELVGFIKRSFDTINSTEGMNPTIAQSFQTCGLDPREKTQEAFEKHLDKLLLYKVYARLIKKQASVDLNATIRE
jgi:hypothetical protein